MSKSNEIVHSIKSWFKTNNPLVSPILLWVFCLSISAILLLFCTKSSPLYPFNDWVDANIFFTMGKGMMNGRVPYRDLFEQKGVLLFFLHGIAYLLSNKTFLGVYFLEVISFSIFLNYCYKTCSLFLDRKYSLITLPLIAISILNLNSFSSGDSAEEFCLPFIAIGLFYLTKYFKCIYPKQISYRSLFFNGILAGCVLWIKFTILGFWVGWMAIIFFCLIINKNFRGAIYSCLFFILGMITASLPWIIYFGLNHAISDWINIYFVSNFMYYAKVVSIFSNIKNLLLQLEGHLHRNPLFCGLLIFGLTFLVTTKRIFTNLYHRLAILLIILILVISVYGGGTGFRYYFLVFSPFIVYGYIILFSLYFEEFGKIKSNKLLTLLLAIAIISTSLFSLQFNQNAYMRKINKEDLVQYKFSSIINQTENPTLLNYGALDIGLYTTTGITPTMKFYCIFNSRYPRQLEEQNEYIKNKAVEFIVTRLPSTDSTRRLEEIPYLYENYELLSSETQVNGDTEFNYFLFKNIN